MSRISQSKERSFIYFSLNKIYLTVNVEYYLTFLLYYLHENVIFFFSIGTPCKAEQPLQGMKLPEKEAQKD